MKKLPPINLTQSIADFVALLPQLPWRPSTNFAFDGTESIHKRLKRTQRSWDESRNTRPEELADHLRRLALACTPDVSGTVAGYLYGCACELTIQNNIHFERPDYQLNRSLSQDEADYIVNSLAEQQTRLDNEMRIIDLFIDGLSKIFATVIQSIPKFEEANTILTIPLYALASNRTALDLFYAPFQLAPKIPDPVAQLVYGNTLNALFTNVLNVSKISLEQADANPHRIQWPDETTPSEDIVNIYLRGTPFQEFLNTPVPFAIPRKTWASHGIILAPPNHGKTQLLGNLIHGFLNEPDPVGAIVLDPHGDLFNTLKDRVDPARLLILDPDTNPPALNFLDFGTSTQAQTLQTFSYLMSSLSGGLSDKQGAIVPYLLKLLRKVPNASLETLRLVVDEKVKGPDKSQFAAAIRSLDPVDQGFFNNQFYSARMQETKDAIGWKLYSALSSDAFRKMFSANSNSFDAHAAIRDRKVVLVKGARTALGDDGMSVFLQFIVSQFFTAALRRESIPAEQRHLCILFADEAHHIFNSQTSNILTECRKYGLGFMGATQVVQQIPDDVKAAIYGATAIKIAGPVSHSDAQVLAREMYTTGDFIRSMKSVERSHADFAFYVTGMTDRAIRVTIPYGTLDNAPVTAASPLLPTARTQQATELSLRDTHEAAPASTAAKEAPRPTEAAPEFELKPGKEW